MKAVSGLYLTIIVFLSLAAAAPACSRAAEPLPSTSMHTIAEQYVRLVLAVGLHDPDYVDAYYGPAGWKPTSKSGLDELSTRAQTLSTELKKIPAPTGPMESLRYSYLTQQLSSVAARIAMLKGQRFPFDQESQALYDATAPVQPESHFEEILTALEKRFPGKGSLVDRYDSFRRPFQIPKDRLDRVFQTAIGACRERTMRNIQLPDGESFTVEYVTNKSWSGYNWYQGGFKSLIQVNTDLPIYIDRAVDLACHEGYPGHHVYNALLEKHLVKDRGWTEFTVYPLFSAQSLIAEGTANYGIEVAFPGDERVQYEQQVLFPAAGIDPTRAREYYEVQALVNKLAYAGNEAARRYLNGEIDATQAAAWLEKYALMPHDRAAQRVRFFDQYRSYVINYNLGKDMVSAFVERRAAGDPAKRWQEFAALISSPRLPSGLR